MYRTVAAPTTIDTIAKPATIANTKMLLLLLFFSVFSLPCERLSVGEPAFVLKKKKEIFSAGLAAPSFFVSISTTKAFEVNLPFCADTSIYNQKNIST